ncbi:hypothetical protein Tco_1124573 [Tanacetum coccineum]|uniref:Uncharacterized protein n=1 Tax=Tanacetum coccineum TaxID=301880 RepID=A0ABQ5J9B7_9ASTR
MISILLLKNNIEAPKAPIDKCPRGSTGASPGTNNLETPLVRVGGKPTSLQEILTGKSLTIGYILIASSPTCLNLLSASTMLGQMANLFVVIAPSVGLACVLPLILLFCFDLFLERSSYFLFLSACRST